MNRSQSELLVLAQRAFTRVSVVCAFFVILCILCCLNGCGRTEASDRFVTIRSSYWGDISDITVWEELARRFHAKQNRIRVKLEHIAGQNYHSKLLAMTVGRCAPDVMASDDEPFLGLAVKGIFEDLAPYVASDSDIKLEEYYPQFLRTFTSGSKQFGLPYIGHCLLIFYNRDHRRAAGLPPDPKENWSWEDFTRDSIALTRDLDGDGRTDQFGCNRLSWFYCLQWVWGAGGTDMDPGMTKYVLDSPEARRGFQFHFDQVRKYHVCPLVSDLPNMTWDAMFLTGKVSMFFTGSWWLSHCRESKDIDWDVAHIPRGPVARATRTTCEALTMAASSTQKKEAWEWIKFVMSDEGQPLFARHGRGIPAVRRIAWQTFPLTDTPQHEERFLEAMDEYARVTSLHQRWMETNTVFDREWDLAMMGKQNIEQFLKKSLPEVNAIVRGEDD